MYINRFVTPKITKCMRSNGKLSYYLHTQPQKMWRPHVMLFLSSLLSGNTNRRFRHMTFLSTHSANAVSTVLFYVLHKRLGRSSTKRSCKITWYVLPAFRSQVPLSKRILSLFTVSLKNSCLSLDFEMTPNVLSELLLIFALQRNQKLAAIVASSPWIRRNQRENFNFIAKVFDGGHERCS